VGSLNETCKIQKGREILKIIGHDKVFETIIYKKRCTIATQNNGQCEKKKNTDFRCF
jgi:hypothetical protein